MPFLGEGIKNTVQYNKQNKTTSLKTGYRENMIFHYSSISWQKEKKKRNESDIPIPYEAVGNSCSEIHKLGPMIGNDRETDEDADKNGGKML